MSAECLLPLQAVRRACAVAACKLAGLLVLPPLPPLPPLHAVMLRQRLLAGLKRSVCCCGGGGCPTAAAYAAGRWTLPQSASLSPARPVRRRGKREAVFQEVCEKIAAMFGEEWGRCSELPGLVGRWVGAVVGAVVGCGCGR